VVSVVAVISVLANIVLLAALWFRRNADHYMKVMSEEDTDRPEFRRFYGDRSKDVTGISGEGVVVEGVVFSDGWGITHWLDRPPMNEPKTEIWHRPWWRRQGPDPFTKISGHGGATKVVWLDKP
jgi:hypothetical protein